MLYDDVSGGFSGGGDVNAVSVFASKLGFTFDFKRTKVWGAEIGDTGEWTGTIGEVGLLKNMSVMSSQCKFKNADYF